MSADDPTPPPALRDLGRERPNARLLRQKVWRRMNIENQHFMGCIVGREGSGKSHSALSIARTVDPGFSADRVFFDPEELLEAFESDRYGAGDVIILDEAGVGLGVRSWYEKAQVKLNQVLQTVRDDNMGVLFTLPRLNELDSQTRGRLHAFVEMNKLDKRRGFAIAKWKRVSPRRDDDSQIYYPYPQIRTHSGTRRLERVKISPPPQSLVEGYEKRKEAFKQELYEDAMEEYEDEDEDDGPTPADIAEEILSGDTENYVSVHGGNGREYIDDQLIRSDFDLSHRDAKAVKKVVERDTDLSTHTTSPE